LATPEAVRALDAIGRKWILVETVGVGQVEVEVAGKADTTVVVVNPGWGDSVQANKAGLMEIADVFVINKADRKGVEETARDLMQMLDLSDLPHDRWRPPIIPTVGSTGAGVPELWEAVRLLDAIGRRWILVETVGVGQVEVEIAGKADTTVVVVNPGWGDSVQANKAGLMEIADVFVINKADRNGVDATRRDLDQMLELSDLPHDAWRPPIVAAVATTGVGVVEVWDAIIRHREHATESGLLAERRAFRTREELREIVAQRLREKAREVCTGDRWDELSGSVVAHTVDPWTAADEMLAPVDA
jgi:putative protein kinase ArgK-like GTPase of G3E family